MNDVMVSPGRIASKYAALQMWITRWNFLIRLFFLYYGNATTFKFGEPARLLTPSVLHVQFSFLFRSTYVIG